MALISHRKKFIFIHIYKTAGTAITEYLIKYSSLTDRITYDFYITSKLVNVINRVFNLWDSGNKLITGYHKHASAIELREYLGSLLYDQYYKFAVVRNPWDWQVSLYFYIKRMNNHKEYNLANKLTFKEFLKYHLDTLPPLQLNFLTDDQDNIIVDKICKFENLHCDFLEILNKINIKCQEDHNKALKLTNISSKRKRDYKIYYDEEAAHLVADYFRKDINYFNYSFDEIS